MREEKKKKKEQDEKHGKNSGHGEIDASVYEEKLRRLIDEVSMILLTTRRTKEKLEQALDLSKKKTNDAFEDVARIEEEVRKLKSEASQSCKNRDNNLTKANQTLRNLKELRSKKEKYDGLEQTVIELDK